MDLTVGVAADLQEPVHQIAGDVIAFRLGERGHVHEVIVFEHVGHVGVGGADDVGRFAGLNGQLNL